jgi:hypothetical protein
MLHLFSDIAPMPMLAQMSASYVDSSSLANRFRKKNSDAILQELMEPGGWKSYEMVLRYAHLAPEHLSNAAARIERGLGLIENDATISLR